MAPCEKSKTVLFATSIMKLIPPSSASCSCCLLKSVAIRLKCPLK